MIKSKGIFHNFIYIWDTNIRLNKNSVNLGLACVTDCLLLACSLPSTRGAPVPVAQVQPLKHGTLTNILLYQQGGYKNCKNSPISQKMQ